jgi:peptidoglycan-N-acetylmuramic acid deacetylase
VQNNELYSKYGGICIDTSGEKVIYLTFDCGYENGCTEKILDTLKQKNVPAAFFVTLPQVKATPQLIARMINEGHIVGNHSVTHPSFAEISTTQMVEEIKGMEKYLKDNFNYSEPYFRFPKGEYTEIALKTVDSLGYTSVFWSLAYADWDLNNQKGEQYAYDKVVSRLHPGAVMLLHSVSPDNANALDEIIDEAIKQGYKFLSLRDYVSN